MKGGRPVESSDAQTAQSLRAHAPALILAAAVAGGIFLNSLTSEFLLDDNYIIVENRQLHDFGKVLTCFGLGYWLDLRASGDIMTFRDYRPVTEISFAIDYALWKLNPIGYHVSSILVHVADTVLLYFLAYRIFPHRTAALFAALLFAAHPIHVEAVVWTKTRAAPLALLFMLVSLLLYARFAGETSGRRRAALYIGSVAAFALALGSKGSAIVLPLLLGLYLWCLGPRARLRGAVLWLLPFAAVGAGYMALASRLPEHVDNIMDIAPFEHFLTVIATPGVYLRLLVLPVGLCLHHYFTRIDYVWHPDVLRAIPWELALLIGIIVAVRYSKKALFALGWILITMIPLSNLRILGRPIAEPRAYVPSVGFCLLVALLLWAAPALGSPEPVRKLLRKASAVLCVLLVGLYSGATVVRNMDWRTNFGLFLDTIAKNPSSVLAHNDLATIYYESGDLETALHHQEYAVAGAPFNIETLDRMAFLCRMTGRHRQAIIYYRRLLWREPENVLAHVGIGISYTEIGEHERAKEHFETAVRLDPESVPAHYNYGVAYIQEGEYERAIPELRRALELQPDHVMAHHSLGLAYDGLGQEGLAVKEYEEALRLRPDRAETWLALGECHEDVGNQEEAIRCYQRCVALAGPSAVEAQKRLALIRGTRPAGGG